MTFMPPLQARWGMNDLWGSSLSASDLLFSRQIWSEDQIYFRSSSFSSLKLNSWQTRQAVFLQDCMKALISRSILGRILSILSFVSSRVRDSTFLPPSVRLSRRVRCPFSCELMVTIFTLSISLRSDCMALYSLQCFLKPGSISDSMLTTFSYRRGLLLSTSMPSNMTTTSKSSPGCTLSFSPSIDISKSCRLQLYTVILTRCLTLPLAKYLLYLVCSVFLSTLDITFSSPQSMKLLCP